MEILPSMLNICGNAQERDLLWQCLRADTAASKALMNKLRLMVLDSVHMGLTNVQEGMRSRSKAFALPPSTVTLTTALAFARNRTDMCLLPPCTRKQQKIQDESVKIALRAIEIHGQVNICSDLWQSAGSHGISSSAI